jgi:hypothetical protein
MLILGGMQATEVHSMGRLPIALAFLAGVLALAGNCAADDNADELKRVEGRYERTYTNNAGTLFRVIKEIAGDQEVVTHFDDVGNIVMANTATIKVEKRGPVRVFSFFNAVITAGPNKGDQHFETVSYIYRVNDDSFVEVWGMLEGDPNQPQAMAWKRVKSPK